MAIVLRDEGIVYVAHPYTASTATMAALQSIGGRRSQEHHDTVGELVAQGMLSRRELDSMTVVTTVRNPFDSLVTWWHRHGRDKSFPDFVRLVVTLSSTKLDRYVQFIRDDRLFWKHGDDCDFTMRRESLQEDLDRLLGDHGAARVEIPKLNVTPARQVDFRTYYDDVSRQIVAEVFAVELRRYGYSFDPLGCIS